MRLSEYINEALSEEEKFWTLVFTITTHLNFHPFDIVDVEMVDDDLNEKMEKLLDNDAVVVMDDKLYDSKHRLGTPLKSEPSGPQVTASFKDKSITLYAKKAREIAKLIK